MIRLSNDLDVGNLREIVNERCFHRDRYLTPSTMPDLSENQALVAECSDKCGSYDIFIVEEVADMFNLEQRRGYTLVQYYVGDKAPLLQEVAPEEVLVS